MEQEMKTMKIEVGVVLPRVLGGLAISLAVAAVGSGAALAAQPLGCLIEPEQVAEVGSPVIGVIEAIRVERGDRVSQGQVLALLRGEVERAAVGVASSRARAAADERAARANVGFARQKLERTQGSARARSSFRSRRSIRYAPNTRWPSSGWCRRANRSAWRSASSAWPTAQLAQRSIRSPFDGVVAERYLSVGERVEENRCFGWPRSIR
jgi:multidrug efflux pump subunit AcrA (membrane-fusion protein)